MGLRRLWCCGRPERLGPEPNDTPPLHEAGGQPASEAVSVIKPRAASQLTFQSANRACAAFLESSGQGASTCWPVRILDHLKAIRDILHASSTSLLAFSHVPGSVAACIINATNQPHNGLERAPIAQGWDGTALYDRLAKYQGADVVTVISRFNDPLLGPEAACVSAHPCSGSLAGTGAGSPAAASPLLLRPDELLALPIAPGGRLVAALLLGWGPASDARPHGHGHGHGGQGKKAPGAAPDGAAGAPILLGPCELVELRRLAQLLGFGLLSDPRQAACLEQLAVLLASLSAGSHSGLDDLLAPLLEGVGQLMRSGHCLNLQPLLAAVPLPAAAGAAAAAAGQQAQGAQTAVVFAPRQPTQPRGLQRAASTPGFGGSRTGLGLASSVAKPLLGGSVLGLASPGPGGSGLADSRPGSRMYGTRDGSASAISLIFGSTMDGGVKAPATGRQGSGLLDYIGGTASGDGSLRGGVGVGGRASGSGVSRVKAVRMALSHTLLQRLLRNPSESGGGLFGSHPASGSAATGPSLPAVSSLVVCDASSQVLEEERPGRDVLLASNLTGAGVVAMMLCTEGPPPPAAAAATHGSGHPALSTGAAAGLNGGCGGRASGGGAYPQAPAAAASMQAARNSPVGRVMSSGPAGKAGAAGSSPISAVLAAALSDGDACGDGSLSGAQQRNARMALPHLPGAPAEPGMPQPASAFMTTSCSGLAPAVAVVNPVAAAAAPCRLALYLVACEAVPVGVLEAVAEEMAGLLPMLFEAFHAAVSAGGAATAEWVQLQAQLLHRATASSNVMLSQGIDLPTPTPGPRRPAPLQAPLPHSAAPSHSPSPLHARAPTPSNPKTPRGGASGGNSQRSLSMGKPHGGGAGATPAHRSLSLLSSGGGVVLGGSSRLRLASPAPCRRPAPEDTLHESSSLSLPSQSEGSPRASFSGGAGLCRAEGGSRRRLDGSVGGGGGGGAGRAANATHNGLESLVTREVDDIFPAGARGHPRNLRGAVTGYGMLTGPVDRALSRKASAPSFLASPVQLEDVAGPRPLELLVSSARTRLSAVAAAAEAAGTAAGPGDDTRLAVQQDLAAVELRDIIGTGGQGVVFLGSLHGLETAIKVWEHNGRAPLEHDGEWLSGGEERPEWNAEAGAQGAAGGDGGEAVGPIVSSEDCIRQAKRGAMEVAVTATLSHPNVVQTYAHFSDVVVVQRAPAPGRGQGPGPGPGPGGGDVPPDCLRLVPHDDPMFRGTKAGPLNTVLCLEYCDAGTLLSAARRGDFRLPGSSGPHEGPVWPDLVPLYTSLLEVALALRYLHSRRLVHCDLKPGNVLLKSAPRDPRGWTCKLSDFGCVRLLDEVGADGSPGFRMAQIFGTVAYMAPECFFKGRLLGSPVDIFAFGVLMWELLHCRTPHAGADPKELPSLVVRSNARPEFHPLAPLEYCALASRCWAPSPERRPTATQLVSQLQRLLEAAKDNASASAAAAEAMKQQRRLPPLQSEQQQPQEQPQPQPQPQAAQQVPQQAKAQASPAAGRGAASGAPRTRKTPGRFSSSALLSGEGRLAERVVLEQAHLAQAQQQQQQGSRG